MIHICGRKVKVQTGTKSQTVNICNSRNLHGEYDYVIRLRTPFISEETLCQKNFSSIEELVSYVQGQHFGEIEKSPAYCPTVPRQLSSNITTAAAVSPARSAPELTETANSSWELAAKLAVEKSIDQFIIEFIQFPYLHRVEHSIHCELFNILTSRRMFSSTYPMGRWATQPVHKEWPEAFPRPEKGNRRGNFDLSIISPQRLKSCSFADFREGRVRPCIVIEMGLDYDLVHLQNDAIKLNNSGIPDSYLVHLVRQDVVDSFQTVEQFILDCGIRTGYARLTSSHAFYKLVNDNKITTIGIPLANA